MVSSLLGGLETIAVLAIITMYRNNVCVRVCVCAKKIY